MTYKQMHRVRSKRKKRDTLPAHTMIAPINTDDLLARAQHSPASLSNSDILQLQRSIGNQAVSALVGGSTIQRGNPLSWLKNKRNQSQYEKLNTEENEKTKKYNKLQDLKEKLLLYTAIHSNYNKFKRLLQNKFYAKIDAAWKLANKVIGWISNVEPSGVLKIISKVSKAVQKLLSLITEARILHDEETREQLTPLLFEDQKEENAKKNIMNAIKDALGLQGEIRLALSAVL